MGDVNELLRIEPLPPERWKDYRELRLEALRTDPDAFGATYESSLQRPDEWWIGHLEVALRDPKRALFFAIEEDRLVGMGGAYPEENPAYVDIVSMFVRPSHRGQGIGRAILQTIVNGVPTKEVRLCVNADQTAAVRLYESFGFFTIAETPLTRQNGTPYTQLYMSLGNGAVEGS